MRITITSTLSIMAIWWRMMAELSCPVTGCKYVVNGINKEDVLRQMEKHRKLAHGRKEMTEDVGPEFRRHGK